MTQKTQTTVLFVGTATVTPGAGQDTACVLLNGDTLVDTGWNAAINMLRFGADPLDVDTLFITHCHHDHYIGLPQLLFYHGMRRAARPDKPPLTVVGPKPDIGMVVDRALHFLRCDQFPEVAKRPEVVALQAGDSLQTRRFDVSTCPTIHPVTGLCYRFGDRETGAVVAITGDTAFHPPIARHASEADLLVHEASRGAVESDPNVRGGHSGSLDAAKIAREARAKALALVHYQSDRREEIVAGARTIFPNTTAPLDGDSVVLPR